MEILSEQRDRLIPIEKAIKRGKVNFALGTTCAESTLGKNFRSVL